MMLHAIRTSGLINAYINRWNQKPIKCTFESVMALFIILTLIAGLLTNGEAIMRILFQLRGLTGTDFYDCFHDSLNIETDIYPPLGQSFFLLLNCYGLVFPGQLDMAHPFGISFYIFFFCAVYLLLFLEYRGNGTSTFKERFFSFAILALSLPSAYCLERGNVLPLSLMFLCLFLSHYDSENKWVRYGAYIALGFSTGFKIYPALFALLLLRDRRYTEFVKCTVIVSAMFLIPYTFANGSFIDHIMFILNFADSSQNIVHFDHINIVNTLTCFGCIFNVDLTMVAQIFAYTIGLVMVLLVLLDKNLEKWKVLACISVLTVGCMGFRPVYAIMFFIPALLIFLDNNKGWGSIDMIYLLCFILMFTPFIQIFFDH